MITTATEYDKSQAELCDLTDRLARLQQTNPADRPDNQNTVLFLLLILPD